MQMVGSADAGSTERMHRRPNLGSIPRTRRSKNSLSTSAFRGSEKTDVVGVKVTRHLSDVLMSGSLASPILRVAFWPRVRVNSRTPWRVSLIWKCIRLGLYRGECSHPSPSDP